MSKALPPYVPHEHRAYEKLQEIDRMNAQIELEERRAGSEILDRVDKANDGNKGFIGWQGRLLFQGR